MAIAQTKEASAVSAAVEEFRKAIIAADRSRLEKLTADELTYGHSSARLENKAQFVDAIANGSSGFSAIELSEQTVNVVDNVALVRHNFLGTRLKGGDKMKLAILTVWVQRQEQWKLLARQAVKI